MAGVLVTVTGNYDYPDGSDPNQGKVSLRLLDVVRDSVANKIVKPKAIEANLNNQGSFSLQVFASDSPDFNPIMPYTVVESGITGSADNTYQILVPVAYAGTGLDLSDVIPVTGGVASPVFPRGEIGYAQAVSDMIVGVAIADLPGLSITFTGKGLPVLVEGFFGHGSITTTSYIGITLTDQANVLKQRGFVPASSTALASGGPRLRFVAASGTSYTFKLRGFTGSGTGTIVASGSNPVFIRAVEVASGV